MITYFTGIFHDVVIFWTRTYKIWFIIIFCQLAVVLIATAVVVVVVVIVVIVVAAHLNWIFMKGAHP